MNADADVVVAGAGNNSLIAAAYLTRAGHRCRVLDARAVAGGGVASAIVMLTDLGSDPEEVMSGAQPAHAGGA